MNIEDDPKLTAYALGELDPAAEAEIAALLREDPTAAAEVEEMRRVAMLLRTNFQAEDSSPLTPEQHAQVLAAAGAPVLLPCPSSAKGGPRRVWVPSAIAAAVMISSGLAFLWIQENQRETARKSAEDFIAVPTVPEPLAAAAKDEAEFWEGKGEASVGQTRTDPVGEMKAKAWHGEIASEAKPAATPAPAAATIGRAGGISPEGGDVLFMAPPVIVDPSDRIAPAAPAAPVLPMLEVTAALANPTPALEPMLPAERELAERSKTDLPASTFITAGKAVQLMDEAKNFEQQGRLDLAHKRAGEALAADPQSAPARKLQGEIQKKREEYGVEGYNNTRARLSEVQTAWDRPVRNFAASSPAPETAAASSAPGAAPASSGQVVEREVLRRNPAKPAPAAPSDSLEEFDRGSSAHPAPANAAGATAAGHAGEAMTSERSRTKSATDSERSARNFPVTPTTPTSFVSPDGTAIPQEINALGQRVEVRRLAGVVPTTPAEFEAPEIPKDFGRRPALVQLEPSNTEAYDTITDNAFLAVRDHPLSTFSIDVDTASYANVRRFLTGNSRPPKGAVRIEELLNYFTYAYPQPQGDDPFSTTLEVATCPWAPEHRLLRVGLRGRDLTAEQRQPANLVFLIDVSGSMQPANKLPLVRESLRAMVAQLAPEDSVGIVVYAGASGVVLQPTTDKAAVREAIDRLESGGSTNGAAGIQAAYELAQRRFAKGRTNRVILATDGDFNVGVTNQGALVELIEKKAKSGVFLTVLGFGYGNLKDSTMEKLADKGNGNYAYIDTPREGRKVLIEQMAGTLHTIAKDVKMQLEFNPAQVAGYRLIGYENRLLKKEDFNDDTKDAGEIGAGHTVTALYEIVPAGKPLNTTGVDALKYQQPAAAAEQPVILGSRVTVTTPASQEMLTLKLRWKAPDGDVSTLREIPLTDSGLTYEKSSRDFRFAASVASFGMLLRDSPHRGTANWDATLELAVEGKGEDAAGYRAEFITLIEKAKALMR